VPHLVAIASHQPRPRARPEHPRAIFAPRRKPPHRQARPRTRRRLLLESSFFQFPERSRLRMCLAGRPATNMRPVIDVSREMPRGIAALWPPRPPLWHTGGGGSDEVNGPTFRRRRDVGKRPTQGGAPPRGNARAARLFWQFTSIFFRRPTRRPNVRESRREWSTGRDIGLALLTHVRNARLERSAVSNTSAKRHAASRRRGPPDAPRKSDDTFDPGIKMRMLRS